MKRFTGEFGSTNLQYVPEEYSISPRTTSAPIIEEPKWGAPKNLPPSPFSELRLRGGVSFQDLGIPDLSEPVREKLLKIAEMEANSDEEDAYANGDYWSQEIYKETTNRIFLELLREYIKRERLFRLIQMRQGKIAARLARNYNSRNASLS